MRVHRFGERWPLAGFRRGERTSIVLFVLPLFVWWRTDTDWSRDAIVSGWWLLTLSGQVKPFWCKFWWRTWRVRVTETRWERFDGRRN